MCSSLCAVCCLGSWIVDVCSLCIGSELFVVCWSLLLVVSWLKDLRCWLFVVVCCCCLFVCWLLFATCCFAVCCVLFVVTVCLLFLDRRALFVVRGVLRVVC